MKMNKKNIILSTLTVILSVLFVVVAVRAMVGSSLTPPSSAFDGSGNPQGTMHTLEDVYNAVPSGTLIWQIDPNLQICYNGSPQNNPAYSMCLPSGGYLDPTGNGTPLLGALQYCQYLEADGQTIAETPQNIWHLPNIDELMEGITQGFFVNSDRNGFQNGIYWSSTPVVNNTGYSWYVTTAGATGTGEDSPISVRCVRPASLTLAKCGDGIIETGEQCDTGGNNNSGCVNCIITSGYTCTGTPSVCGAANGTTCTSNSNCASNICNSSNVCSAGLTGISSCVRGSDCVSGWCDTNANICVANGTPASGYTCLTSSSGPYIDNECFLTAQTWQSTKAPDNTGVNAITYCNNLDANEVEQSTAQHVWRLPSAGQLKLGLTNQYVTQPPTVSGFSYYGYGYASSTPFGISGYIWVGNWSTNYVNMFGNFGNDSNYIHGVRCIR
jgi:hypothetical protein